MEWTWEFYSFLLRLRRFTWTVRIFLCWRIARCRFHSILILTINISPKQAKTRSNLSIKPFDNLNDPLNEGSQKKIEVSPEKKHLFDFSTPMWKCFLWYPKKTQTEQSTGKGCSWGSLRIPFQKLGEFQLVSSRWKADKYAKDWMYQNKQTWK